MLEQGTLQFSIITYYESLSGLLYKDVRQQMGRFQAFVNLHRVLPLTMKSANISATIEAGLRRRGSSIGPTDTLIAGVALANSLASATNNTQHYERIEGLQLVNWTI